MHILITTDVVGGVWDFSCALARELQGRGHRASLLAFGAPSAGQRQQAAACAETLAAEDLKLEWMQGSARDVQQARALTAETIERLRPDVLQANQFALGSAKASVPVVLTAHSDVLSWSKWTQGARPGSEWRGYEALVQEGLAGADAVVAVSHFLAGELRELYALKREVTIIHNAWPAPASMPAEVSRRPRVSLLAGRALDKGKNIGLAAAAAQGWDTGRVLLAGPIRGPDDAQLAELAPPIEPLGALSQPELQSRLAQARVYVSPARYDPFGLLPLQAALSGCALLLSDIPSYRELWDGAALFFAATDAADLRRQWQRLLDDDLLACALAGEARSRALARYGPGHMAESYLDLYSSAARSRRAEVAQTRVAL